MLPPDRTFIAREARKIIEDSGSLRDVQQLAGHISLATTQRHIKGDSDARCKAIGSLQAACFSIFGPSLIKWRFRSYRLTGPVRRIVDIRHLVQGECIKLGSIG